MKDGIALVRRRSRPRKGVATVELAVTLPLLIFLVFAIIELGWYLHMSQVFHNAARQGARASTRIENSNAQVEAVVNNCLLNNAGIDSNAVSIEITRLSWAGEEEYQVMDLGENEQGEPIRVSVTVDYSQTTALTNMLGFAGWESHDLCCHAEGTVSNSTPGGMCR